MPLLLFLKNMKRILSFMVSLLICITSMAQQVTTHTVAPGETLASIASKYGVSEEALKEANPETKKHLYTGMELAIPNVNKNVVSPVVPSPPNPAPINAVVPSENKKTTNNSYTNETVTFNDKEGNAGKVSVAGEALFSYLIPSFGEDSEYMEAEFSCGMALSMGARFYPTNNIYVEGMAGWKWLLSKTGLKGSKSYEKNTYTFHYVTIPLHVGVTIPSSSKIAFGLFGGTRIDIPVSSKMKKQEVESTVNIPVTALLEVGLDIKIDSDNTIRLQYDYSPSEKNRYSLISIGWNVGI